MNRRSIAAIVILLTAASAFAVWRFHAPYQDGKSVRTWLALVASTNEAVSASARAALQKLGTNAIPAVLERARAEDSALRSNVIRLLSHQQLLPVPRSSATSLHRQAYAGLAALGGHAAAAIPNLVGMLEDPSTANRASYMLCSMGDEVIPALLIAITNTDTQVRLRTVVDLGYRRANDNEVIDALLECLAADSDPSVRSASALALARIPDLPDDAMGALVTALNDPASSVNAARALGEAFGSRARSAIPDLVEHWRRNGGGTSEALTMIDSETAKSLGAMPPPNPYE